jgi:hypothetical protein
MFFGIGLLYVGTKFKKFRIIFASFTVACSEAFAKPHKGLIDEKN